MIVWLCKRLCEQMPILGCIHYEWIRGLCDWAWCNYLGFSVHKFYMYVDNFKLGNLHFSSLLWALWLQPAESNVCVSWSSWASLPAKHHSPYVGRLGHCAQSGESDLCSLEGSASDWVSGWTTWSEKQNSTCRIVRRARISKPEQTTSLFVGPSRNFAEASRQILQSEAVWVDMAMILYLFDNSVLKMLMRRSTGWGGRKRAYKGNIVNIAWLWRFGQWMRSKMHLNWNGRE